MSRLEELFTRGLRIIEIGANDLTLATYLRARDQKYLGLVNEQLLPETPPDLAPYIWPYTSAKQLEQNNAQVLILSGDTGWHLWAFDAYAHAQYVLWSPQGRWELPGVLFGLLKNIVLQRVRFAGLERLTLLDGTKRSFLVLEVLKRKAPHARRHLSPSLGIEGFFRCLRQKNVNYTLLRWFETLPVVPEGEDVDLLVADEDLATVEKVLDEQPGILPCDLYSVSGTPGTDYKGMAYYPPPQATELITNAVWQDELYRVPPPDLHFLSLAYHALYHKGYGAGLPTLQEGLGSQKEHDYTATLERLAASLELELPITMEGLDHYLAGKGWQPASDTLARFTPHNPWLAAHLSMRRHQVENNHAGLAVFFIRQRALDLGYEATVLKQLESEGFYILKTQPLTPEAGERVRRGTRGGNWGKGPYSISGGAPAVAVLCLDLLPIPPSSKTKKRFPALENERLLVKEKLRTRLNATLPEYEHSNLIHSSDNRAEALYYLQLALPEEKNELLARAEALQRAFTTDQPVVKVLTKNGRRAKLEVINYQGALAVKKTFKPGCERFLERERFVLGVLSKQNTEIPPLLEGGDNYIIYPHYQDTLHLDRGSHRPLIPLSALEKSLNVLRFFYDLGYAHGDFTPGNLIRDKKAGIKIIDFEFFYQYKLQPESFEQSYDFVGPLSNFSGDVPKDVIPTYASLWQPLVGLTLHELLYATPLQQHLIRLRYILLHTLRQSLQRRYKNFTTSSRDTVYTLWQYLAPTRLGTMIKWMLS
jgi:hypothetical protein